MATSLGKVIDLIESWRPRSCETEKEFEKSLMRHLEKNLEKAEIIQQYAAGRLRGDIVVDGKILIEIKQDLDSTGKLQRLLGQIELYNSKWNGQVVVVLCGESKRDLLQVVRDKINALGPRFLDWDDPKIYLRIK